MASRPPQRTSGRSSARGGRAERAAGPARAKGARFSGGKGARSSGGKAAGARAGGGSAAEARPRAKAAREKPQAKAPRAGASRRARARAGRPRIVVGYDGSPEARHAAVWAARRAAPDGSVLLVHASGPRRRWLPIEILRTGSERTQLGRALIDELLMSGEQELLDVKLQAHVVAGTPAKVLRDAAEQHEADEIVVGSHHPRRADPIYGDVAAELVRSAPVPVIVVPLGGHPA
jgi:nucleotide-binding universal stress UspA family protein